MTTAASEPALDTLVALLRGRRLAVLTGAGISTESGIPDYRGPETRRRARNPMRYNAFVGSESARTRYWARSYLGWPRVSSARPNAAHDALAELESRGVVAGVVTQNVDGLHHAAGSHRVVELHGALRRVHCLHCGTSEARASVQGRLAALNPGFTAEPTELAPDGDAELSTTLGFVAARCLACGGPLKPSVVFFGENVPRPVVDRAWSIVDDADALLVVGSSLTVFSGYRFVREAAQRGMPVAIVNLGATRGDPVASVKVEVKAGLALPTLAARL